MNYKCYQKNSINIFSYLLQIFEWWYFKKYGTSFIEQVSLNHISPLLGGNENPNQENNNTTSSSTPSSSSSSSSSNSTHQQSMPGKVLDESNVFGEARLLLIRSTPFCQSYQMCKHV